jgi:cysteinyl-tRNA synthetase
VPVKDGNGEIPKNRRKKLMKDWERQKKMHEQWLVRGS